MGRPNFGTTVRVGAMLADLPAFGGGAPVGRPNFGTSVRVGDMLAEAGAVASLVCGLVGVPGELIMPARMVLSTMVAQEPARVAAGGTVACSTDAGAADATAVVSGRGLGTVSGALWAVELTAGAAVGTSEPTAAKAGGAEGAGGGASAGEHGPPGKSTTVRCHQIA